MDAWVEENGHAKGAVLRLDTLWELAKAWYDGRMDPAWRGRAPAASQKILDGLELKGDFWRLE